MLVRQKFRRKIRRGEYKFIFAQNGVEALKALESEPDTDLVLTDINMPEMYWLTLLSEFLVFDLVLRSVVVSAYGDMQNIRTAMNRGAIDFITKPIDFQDLEVTIAKTLEDVLQLKTALEREKQAREALEQLNDQLEERITERTRELEEYVNLAYHGLRAQDTSFNITIESDYDESLEQLSIVPQDISRVFLNILNKACYAAHQRSQVVEEGFPESQRGGNTDLATCLLYTSDADDE